jgi:hypothetical protein
MLEDVQMRFVYRTHIYIKEEILDYNPSAGDLSYPEKLEIMEQIALSIKKSSSETEIASAEAAVIANNATNTSPFKNSSPKKHMSPADTHGMWYPTLRRTLICLSKLYRCVDVNVTLFNICKLKYI